MRACFYGALQTTIDEFFRKIAKQPHQATITPIGDAIDDKVTEQYGYVAIKHSLAMDHDKVAYLAPKDEESLLERILARCCRGYDLYGGITEILELESEDSDTDLEMQETWNSLLSSTRCVQDLVRDMEGCIQELKSGESIGNETLYDLTMNVVAIQSVLNLHEENGVRLRELVATAHKQGKSVRLGWLRESTSATVAVCTMVLTGILPLAALLAAVLMAGGALYTGYRELGPPSIRKAIKYEAAATEFRKDLGHAHIALAGQFCSQVLKVPPHLMSKVERKRILCEFGIDTTKLTNKEYTAELVAQRMEKVCKRFKKLEKLGQEVAKAVGHVG
ncbi:unnamed protein product [Parascedosporium putredinis]|uniref:Uncharacterized protein n=1 Tax=Parascedosporium putredinis TaxID=1442378 RepID=A0A9P1H5S7_9PEZI|nr:unnamed protein product [Parascedosporium putredinis]CAI7996791.1 unnamed protein product [Parascedosporium putredinis]